MTEAHTRSSMRAFLAECRNMPARDLRNSWRATAWLFGWAVTFVAAVLLIKKEVIPAGWPSYIAAVVPTLLAVAAMLAYVKFIREADELQRKIQLEALGLGFGAGFVASFTFRILQVAGVESLEVVDVFGVMFVFYMVGIFLGARRYM